MKAKVPSGLVVTDNALTDDQPSTNVAPSIVDFPFLRQSHSSHLSDADFHSRLSNSFMKDNDHVFSLSDYESDLFVDFAVNKEVSLPKNVETSADNHGHVIKGADVSQNQTIILSDSPSSSKSHVLSLEDMSLPLLKKKLDGDFSRNKTSLDKVDLRRQLVEVKVENQGLVSSGQEATNVSLSYEKINVLEEKVWALEKENQSLIKKLESEVRVLVQEKEKIETTLRELDRCRSQSHSYPSDLKWLLREGIPRSLVHLLRSPEYGQTNVKAQSACIQYVLHKGNGGGGVFLFEGFEVGPSGCGRAEATDVGSGFPGVASWRVGGTAMRSISLSLSPDQLPPLPIFFIYSQEHPTGGGAVFRPPRTPLPTTPATTHTPPSLNHILNPKLKLGGMVGCRWMTAATMADCNGGGRAATTMGGCGWWLWAALLLHFYWRMLDEGPRRNIGDDGVWWWCIMTGWRRLVGGEVGFANSHSGGGW
ncbi:unnamed protein product [Lactuca virosa]|uniref:Uncharacterized protein n=1 Tax=Lactuca virosa TaxID=75947 RepID=A0AAU9MJQ5_9ASTR|nr:unnamed protein product [Lactuca virosa]